MIGLWIAGTTALSHSPCHWMADDPAAASPEPTRPPIRACDDEDGSPRYQVARFHAMAPSSAAISSRPVMSTVGLSRSFQMNDATAVDTNAPAKLASEAISTAIRGGSARVDTVVATALAVSWKPLVKSKASAIAMTATSTASVIGS